MRRLVRLGGAVAALLVGSTVVAPASTAQEDLAGTFSGTAAADGPPPSTKSSMRR